MYWIIILRKEGLNAQRKKEKKKERKYWIIILGKEGLNAQRKKERKKERKY